MNKWQLIVTALGEESWEKGSNGKPYVESVTRMLSFDKDSSFVMASREKSSEKLEHASLIPIPSTRGALCTALYSIEYLDMSMPIVVSPGNFTLNFDIHELLANEFSSGDMDAFALTFQSMDSRYSYARLGENGEILEYCEKDPVSTTATTGIFGFRSAHDFYNASKWVLLNNINLNGRFYVSSAINYFIMSGKRIGNIELKINENDFIKNWEHHANL